MKTTKFLIICDDVDHDGATPEQHERIQCYWDITPVFIDCIHPIFADNCIEIGDNRYVRDAQGSLYYVASVLSREDVINGFERTPVEVDLKSDWHTTFKEERPALVLHDFGMRGQSEDLTNIVGDTEMNQWIIGLAGLGKSSVPGRRCPSAECQCYSCRQNR